MEYQPSPAAVATTDSSSSARRGRRHHYRHRVATLAYVMLDHNNGAIIRDISESGMAVQAVTPLRSQQEVQVRFDLLRPRMHVEAQGRTAWADSGGQAGIEFLNLPEHVRRSLKQWNFTQLLMQAARLVKAGSFFSPLNAGRPESGSDLMLSAAPRPPIRLAQPERIFDNPAKVDVEFREDVESPEEGPSSKGWLFSSISQDTLARTVDVAIVLAAVLLFSGLALATVNIAPTWPEMFLAFAGAACAFALVYWFLFAMWIGETPGARFVRRRFESNPKEEDRPRFR